MTNRNTSHSAIAVDAGEAKSPFDWAVGATLLAIVVVGIGLRTVQSLANTSMWLDEIALVKGIWGADLWSLLARPLPFDQVAPKGFLLAQKLAVMAFGPSDTALRLFPFLCSTAALIVFARLARRALAPAGAISATLLFATAAPFVTFGGLVKQYSTDVLVTVVLTSLALQLVSGPTSARKAWRVAIAGALLVWFSQPGVIVVAALATPVLAWLSPDGPTKRWRLPVLIVSMWGASALAATLVSMASMSDATRNYMQVYWADGFAPPSLDRAIALAWPWPNIRLLFAGGPGAQAGLGYPLSPLYPVLAGIGFVALWFQRRRVAVVLVAPVALTLAAAIVRQYPFRDRLILFLVPALILAVGAAIQLAYTLLRRVSVPMAGLAAGALALGAVIPIMASPPPYRIEDVKSLLAQIEAKRQPGDATYVFYGAAPVMSVYAQSFGYRRGDYLVGGCHRADSRRYLEELDTFHGTPRVWVILTHSFALYREREDILGYLDATGNRLDEVRVVSHAMGRTPAPAEAYLYDLSGNRPGGVSSATFTLTGTQVLNPRSGCVNGPQVMIPSDFHCGLPNKRCTRRPNPGSLTAAGERGRYAVQRPDEPRGIGQEWRSHRFGG